MPDPRLAQDVVEDAPFVVPDPVQVALVMLALIQLGGRRRVQTADR